VFYVGMSEDVINEEEFIAYKRSFDKNNLVSFEEVKKELGL
tara:strand:+ start:391 stop:513 length:123 start_codon:yes stop_codon:yes gene_type:complete